MKLLLDLGRIVLSRLAILCLVALFFISSDAYDANQENIELAQQQLIEQQILIHKKNEEFKTKLARHTEKQRKQINEKLKLGDKLAAINLEIFDIERKLKWYNRPISFKKKKKLKALKKERKKLNKRITSLALNIGTTFDYNLTSEIDAIRASFEAQHKDIWTKELVSNSLDTHKTILSILFLGLFFGPISVKAVNFYLFAPLAKKVKPITIVNKQEQQSGEIQYGTPQKEIPLNVDKSHSLIVRPGWFNQNTEGTTVTRLFWDWTNPFASYAMGLVGMTEFKPDEEQTRVVKVASEEDPNHDILPIHLNDHPGYVIKHGHVVAISGDGLVMRKRWQILDWKSWLFGNIRYVYFTGTGSIYIHGYGSVSTNDTITNSRIKERHLIGFDTRTPFRMVRTETFINYWLNNKPLYDINFPAQGLFLQQQAFGRKDEKIFRSLLEDIMGAVGKVLGF